LKILKEEYMPKNKYKKHILLHVSDGDNITVGTYEEWEKDKDKDKIADLIYQRLYCRYLKPFEYDDEKYRTEYKNSFAIMANNCLLIETLESFYRGWNKTSGKSEQAFCKFFSREKLFQEFSNNDIPTIFYKNIRCGILHQGETTGGWRISRGFDETDLLNIENKFIHAVKFQEKLKESLKNYKNTLIEEDWSTDSWKNARKKMNFIIKNCK
jgi:hypothetical protein